MNVRYIVCGIIQHNGKILLGKKAKGRPPYPDVWHTPGGGVEDFQQAEKLISEKDYNNKYFRDELRREMKEELGIVINNIKCIIPKYRDAPREGITKNKNGEDTHYYFLEYLCETGDEKLLPGDDLVDAKWVTKKELQTIDLTTPSKEMYRELGWIKHQ